MKRLPARLFLSLIVAFALAARAQDPQKPEAKPEEAKQEPARPEAPAAPERAPGQAPDPAILEGIFACIAEGLPKDWQKAWFVIRETARSEDGKSRSFAADFFYATSVNDRKGRPLKPCGPDRVLEGVGALNDYLPDGQRRWTGATFTFLSDGKFDAKYDYAPVKPKPAARPAAKPAAKKKTEAAK